jgi:prefoldin subunit 5
MTCSGLSVPAASPPQREGIRSARVQASGPSSPIIPPQAMAPGPVNWSGKEHGPKSLGGARAASLADREGSIASETPRPPSAGRRPGARGQLEGSSTVLRNALLETEEANGFLSQQLQKARQAHAEAVRECEGLKGHIQAMGKERGREQQQVNRLYDQLEEARAEARHLRQLLDEKAADLRETCDAEDARVATLMAANEGVSAARDALQKKVEGLERQGADMRQHINKLDRYLMTMAGELDETREARTQAEARAAQARQELERRGESDAERVQDLKALLKSLQRTQGTRRSFERILENLEGIMDGFKASALRDSPAELCRRLAAAQDGGQAGTVGLQDLVFDLRKVSAEAQALGPQLLDEVAAGRRESEFLAKDLDEMGGRLRKLIGRLAGSNGGTGPGAGAGAGAMQDVAAPSKQSVSQRLQVLDDAADETAQMLRGLMRSRVGNVHSLLRNSHQQQTDLMFENERLRKEGASLHASLADITEAKARIDAVSTNGRPSAQLPRWVVHIRPGAYVAGF